MPDEQPTDFDWTAARGEKWRAQLAGMEAMLAPVDEPLVHALHLDAPLRIADVACGGGGTTFEILRRAPIGSVVHGFDLAPGLIDAARARAPNNELAVSFTVADVATLPPPKEPYERLVSRFGVMFFEDPPAAFSSLRKWLVPGGRFAFAVWGRPADNPWVTILRDVIAEFVGLPPPVPDAPGPFRYGQVEVLLALLRQAGFGEPRAREWRGPLAIGGGLPAAQATDFALAAFSVAEPLAKADEAVQEAAHRFLTERFSMHLREGIVEIDACVHVIEGSPLGERSELLLSRRTRTQGRAEDAPAGSPHGLLGHALGDTGTQQRDRNSGKRSGDTRIDGRSVCSTQSPPSPSPDEVATREPSVNSSEQ